MFLNKKKATDKDRTVTDFKMRTPYGSYRPVDYKEYAPFISLKPTLDDYLKKLFAGDSIDEGSGDVFDPHIIDMAAQAEQDLKRQQINHTDNIHNMKNRRAGDRLAFERQREQLTAALAENEQELADIADRERVNKF